MTGPETLDFGKNSRHKFRVGQRVRPSAEGRAANVFTSRTVSGTVTKVDEWNSPTVLWDHRKTGSSYAPWFIEPDRRKLKGAIP